jgi:hypothetical protein
VNTKSPYIPKSSGGENTGEVNKALEWRGFVGYLRIIPSKPRLVNNTSGKFWDTK